MDHKETPRNFKDLMEDQGTPNNSNKYQKANGTLSLKDFAWAPKNHNIFRPRNNYFTSNLELFGGESSQKKKRKNPGLLLGSFIFALPSAFDEAILVTMEVTRILMRSWPKHI